MWREVVYYIRYMRSRFNCKHFKGSYLLTRAAVELLHKNMGKVKRKDLRMEDVFITGMIRTVAGIEDIRSLGQVGVLRKYQELNPFF